MEHYRVFEGDTRSFGYSSDVFLLLAPAKGNLAKERDTVEKVYRTTLKLKPS